MSLVMGKFGNPADGKLRISQSDLRDFFPCQRRWLFNRLLRLDDDSLTGELAGPFDIGNINHKVLERFMLWRMKNKLSLPVTGPDGTFGDEVGLSQIMIAIDPGKFNDGETTDRIIRELIDDLHTSVPVQEGGRVFYPGELELGTRKENREKGIPVNDEVWNIIRSK